MSEFEPSRRLRVFALTAFLATLAILGLVADAAHRQSSADRSDARSAVRMIGFADLALSSSARWLRAPSQAERTAPLTDAPLSFDTDPAGGVIGPP